MHYLYRISNTINNKIYIGQCTYPVQRWYLHRKSSAEPKQVIHHAIKKHGTHNFIFDVIACCKTQDDTNDTEKLLIKQYGCIVPNGYNVAPGGKVISGKDHWMYGKKHTAESKQKMSEATKGKPKSDEHKQKCGLAFRGHHHTDESKAKIASGNTGQKRSEETKQQLSKQKMGNTNWKNSSGCKPGFDNCQSSLTREQAEQIYQRNQQGESIVSLAKEFGVNRHTISRSLAFLQTIKDG